jgi:hypothetical protein
MPGEKSLVDRLFPRRSVRRDVGQLVGFILLIVGGLLAFFGSWFGLVGVGILLGRINLFIGITVPIFLGLIEIYCVAWWVDWWRRGDWR